jgi:hypothetical protein
LIQYIPDRQLAVGSVFVDGITDLFHADVLLQHRCVNRIEVAENEIGSFAKIMKQMQGAVNADYHSTTLGYINCRAVEIKMRRWISAIKKDSGLFQLFHPLSGTPPDYL